MLQHCCRSAGILMAPLVMSRAERKTLLLLAAVGLAQARPNEENPISGRRYEFHPDCPPIHEHYLIPHEFDCRLFYYCEYGLKWIIPRECAPGTHFSASDQVCTHPFAAGCTLPGPGGSTTQGPTGPCDPTTTTTCSPPTTTTTSAPAPTTTTTSAPAPTTTTPAPTTTTTTPAPTTTTTTPAPTTTAPAPTSTSATEPPCDTDAPGPNPTTGPTTTTLNPDDLLDNGCPADFDIHHLLPHERYCNKFYMCIFGDKVESICADGTHFNFEIQACDWPHNVNCDGEDYIRPPTTTERPTGPCDPTTTTTTGPCATRPTTAEPAPTTTTTTTPAPTTTTTTTPAPTTTTTTTTPAPTTTTTTTTPAPTTTTTTTTTTPAPEPTNPPEPTTTPAPATTTTTTTTSTPTEPPCDTDPPAPGPTTSAPTTTTLNPDDLLDNGCPSDFDIHHLLPHETYCNKFYYCVAGEKVERICANGTHFNFELQICDWPHNVNCDGEDFTNPPTNPTTTEGPSGDDDIGVLLPNECPANFSIHHLLPHETHCNKFYYCVFGEKIERTCPEGTLFNFQLQVCDWPYNVNCEGSDLDEDSEEDSGSIDDDVVGDDDGDNDDDDGSVWEPLPNGCPADFDVHHILPHESNCSKFYYCVHGQKVERECPGGTHFNPIEQVCDWPQFAGCENWDDNDNSSGDNDSGDNDNDSGDNDNDSGDNDNESGDNDNDSGDNDNNSGDNDNDSGDNDNESGDNDNDSGDNDNESGDNDNDSGDNDNESGDNDNESGDNDNDSGDNDGCDGTCPVSPTEKCRDECNVVPWAHDSDCDKYWICNGNEPLLITCSEGLHFNPNTKTCDFNCNAGCVRRSVQATERVDGVSLFVPWDKIDNDMKKLLSSKLDL